MEKNLLQELENAQKFNYINLLPNSMKQMAQVSSIAQQILIKYFGLQLSKNQYQDEKQSTDSEYDRYVEEVDSFNSKIMKRREEMKRDEDIERLIGDVQKEMSIWAGRFNQVGLASKKAFERTKEILKCLIPSTDYYQLKKQKRKSRQKINKSQLMVKITAQDISKSIIKCQRLMQRIHPSKDFIKSQIIRELALNFDKPFNEQMKQKYKTYGQTNEKIKLIKESHDQMTDLLNEILELGDDYESNLLNLIQKQSILKQKITSQLQEFELNFGKDKLLKLEKINITQIRNIISDMITANEKISGINSKFLIQPLYNSKQYLVADVTSSVISSKRYTAPIQFYQYSGFAHLSTSLIVAGGYKNPNSFNKVHQIFENHQVKYLPSMKLARCVFPLVEFNDGATIIAICGNNGKDQMRECQRLDQFKSWSDLPSTLQKFKGASACSVGKCRVFVLKDILSRMLCRFQI